MSININRSILRAATALAMVAGASVLAGPTARASGSVDCTDFPLGESGDPGAPAPHLVIGEVVDGGLDVGPGVGCVVIDSTVNGDVVAADGAFAVVIVEGSVVHGDIDVGAGAMGTLAGASVAGTYECDECLFFEAYGVDIGGDVTGAGAQQGAIFLATTIDGDLTIKDFAGPGNFFLIDQTAVAGKLSGKGNTGPWLVRNSTIGGKLDLRDNVLSEPMFNDFFGFDFSGIVDSSIGGKLTYDRNGGTSIEISGNDVGGKLTCMNNEAAPTGGGNVATSKRGQCAEL